MKTKHLPQYPRIAASDLARLTLDNASGRQFDSRFRPVELGVMFLVCASFVVGYLLYRADTISANVCGAIMFGAMIPGLAVLFIAHRQRLHARPVSIQSGQQMQPYVVQEREQADSIEIAYIDQSSGTYFTRLYVA